jgi:pre-mRNA-processing factor 40
LGELRASKLINAKTDWMDIYPHLKDDLRYQNMLGQPGSSPLDLLWDMVDELGERFYKQKRIVYDILKVLMGSMVQRCKRCEKDILPNQ